MSIQLGIPEKISNLKLRAFYIWAIRALGLGRPSFVRRYNEAEVEIDQPWSSAERLAQTQASLDRVVAESELKSASILSGSISLLPPLLEEFISQEECVSVLDFGGGNGIAYFRILPAIKFKEKVFWHTVDHPSLIEQGAAHKNKFPKISFSSALPDAKFDVIYINTVLQYIENCENLLNELIDKYAPYSVLLTRLLAGNYPPATFLQLNIAGGRTLARFLNLSDLIKVFEKKNYRLVYETPAEEDSASATAFETVDDAIQYNCSRNVLFRKQEIKATVAVDPQEKTLQIPNALPDQIWNK